RTSAGGLRPPADHHRRRRTRPDRTGAHAPGHGVLRRDVHHSRTATGLRDRLGRRTRRTQLLPQSPTRARLHRTGRDRAPPRQRTARPHVPRRARQDIAAPADPPRPAERTRGGTMTGTVVVLTALDLEYRAVRAHLDDIETHRHEAGTRYESGTVRGTTCRITLGLTGVGNHASAVIAERAIQQFAPAALLFVGVAGSLWPKPGLGDVVVAERVYAYHGGTSEDDGLKARPRAWEAPHTVSQLAHHIERSNGWRDRLPPGS